MKKDILSLKSLYQFLVISDYPMFSSGIITKSNHKGLTLTKFWKDNILVDFRSRKYGKQIWREEGGRNRYISDICNRSGRISFYREYAEEIWQAATPEAVRRQIGQFMSFLLDRQFDYGAFVQKLPVYIKLLSAQDESFSAEAAAFFMRLFEKRESFGEKNTARTFFCGYVFTFFTIHALSGNGEGEALLSKIREDDRLSIENLEKLFSQDCAEKKSKAEFLTGRNTELGSMPLKQGHFFGREKELFELRQMLLRGGKYLVSGIGGIGKTELMRQLLKCCEEEGLADYICVAQYEGSLADSLIKAFPEVCGTDRESNFKEVIARIHMHTRERVLLVIDNVGENCSREPELQRLLSLSAAIFFTSRCQEIAGMETYEIKTIEKEAGCLLFRDNYEKVLTKDDRRVLEDIMSREVWRHTLTLRLLGCVARTRGWTIQELRRRLEEGESLVSLEKEAGYESLGQLYQRMYAVAGIKKEMNEFLQVFALLPYQSYSTEFVAEYLQDFLKEGMEAGQGLKLLWAGGWLERQEESYAMHPFIAECLQAKPLGEREISPFWERVAAQWAGKAGCFQIEEARDIFGRWYGVLGEEEQERLQNVLLVFSVSKKLKGAFSERFLQLLLFAAETEYNHYGASAERLVFLTSLKKRCKAMTEQSKAYLYMLLCCHGYKNVKELDKEFKRLSAGGRISQELLCAYAAELAGRYSHLGDDKAVKELTAYIWENGKKPGVRMMACNLEAKITMGQGDFAGYEKWLKKGIAIGKRGGWEKSREVEELGFTLCGCYLAMQKFKEAEDILKEEEMLLEGGRSYFLQWELLFYKGSLAMYRGDEGYGVENLLEAYAYAKSLFAGREDDNYADSIAELAMACNKAGRREEAQEYYEKAYAVYETVPGHDFAKYRVLNNMSVMYLDWEKPEKALKCLTKAEQTGREMGGLSEAELNNNLSKAYRLMGDKEKALHYLREAVPVLEQFYGSAHPKVVEAKERLMEEKRR